MDQIKPIQLGSQAKPIFPGKWLKHAPLPHSPVDMTHQATDGAGRVKAALIGTQFLPGGNTELGDFMSRFAQPAPNILGEKTGAANTTIGFANERNVH